MSAKKKAIVTLGVGVALLAVVGALTLTRSPPRAVGAGAQIAGPVAQTTGDMEVCQAGEALPAGVSAIRLAMWAFFGANIHVKVFSGSRVLTEGARGPDWTGNTVTVPVTALHRAVSPVKVCFRIGPNSQPILLLGAEAPQAIAAKSTGGEPLAGRVGIEYLAPGRDSWWSRILQVSRLMGIGHALTGTWVVLLIFALMVAAGVLSIRVVLRELT
jgi:hypothetical protein